VFQRVASPDLQAADLALRKSEAGLVGLIAASENPEVVASSQEANEGKGWVVVDIEGKPDAPKEEEIPMVASPEPQTPTSPSALSKSHEGSKSPGMSTPISHAAKAIAAVDAIEAKNKSSSKSSKASTDSPSGIRKFFSIGRKNSNPPSPSPSVQNVSSGLPSASKPAVATEVSVDDTKRAIEMVHNASEKKASPKEKEKPPTTSRLRDKLRRIGTPEASRNEDKRRSIN
jgi:hypothetical protein